MTARSLDAETLERIAEEKPHDGENEGVCNLR